MLSKFRALNKTTKDIAVVIGFMTASFVIAQFADLGEAWQAWAEAHEAWEVDEVPFAIALTAVALTWFSVRRWLDFRGQLAVARRIAEEINAHAEEVEAAHEKLSQQTTAMAQLAIDLEAAKLMAESASAAKSDFLANTSHELRTPLNAIIGFSEIIKNETFGPVGSTKYRGYAVDINDSGKHLLRLINDILDLSKIEAGKQELWDEELDVGAVVEAAVKMVRARAEDREVGLEVKMPADLPQLRADEGKLIQILVNLLSNAIKFTDAGGKVAISAWGAPDDGVVLQVADTGIGIAAEDIPTALAQFGQVESAMSRRYQGSGLGLPLTKAMVELHDGWFDFQSEKGVGTTVNVRFPAERTVTARRGLISRP